MSAPTPSEAQRRRSKDSWPRHAYATAHEFRAKKRRDVRAAVAAVSELRMGCAYTPAGTEIVEALRLLERVQSMLSVKEWKR